MSKTRFTTVARRMLLLMSLAGGLVLASAPTAGAHGGHAGCAAFGEHVSTDAKTLQPSGRLVSQFARVGFIDEHIASDHAALC